MTIEYNQHAMTIEYNQHATTIEYNQHAMKIITTETLDRTLHLINCMHGVILLLFCVMYLILAECCTIIRILILAAGGTILLNDLILAAGGTILPNDLILAAGGIPF